MEAEHHFGWYSEIMYYVYVLRGSSNPKYYIGYSSQLRQRLKQHNAGKVTSTKRGIPWQVIYYEAFGSEELAREREAKLKQRGRAWQELKKRIT